MASVMAFKQPDADLWKVVNPCDPSLTVTELASRLTAVAAIPSTEQEQVFLCTDRCYQRIGVECYNTAVIGDFTEQEARDFLVQQPDIPNIDNEEGWQTVYKTNLTTKAEPTKAVAIRSTSKNVPTERYSIKPISSVAAKPVKPMSAHTMFETISVAKAADQKFNEIGDAEADIASMKSARKPGWEIEVAALEVNLKLLKDSLEKLTEEELKLFNYSG
eukprot:5493-Heterococcus_DN1.PRE.3